MQFEKRMLTILFSLFLLFPCVTAPLPSPPSLVKKVSGQKAGYEVGEVINYIIVVTFTNTVPRGWCIVDNLLSLEINNERCLEYVAGSAEYTLLPTTTATTIPGNNFPFNPPAGWCGSFDMTKPTRQHTHGTLTITYSAKVRDIGGGRSCNPFNNKRSVENEAQLTTPNTRPNKACIKISPNPRRRRMNEATIFRDRELSSSPQVCPYPVSTCSCPVIYGDPHLRTWDGEKFDFHGVCDLVLLSNHAFLHGHGMDIHIRTEKMRLWSYVSSAAVRIGGDVLEVQGGGVTNAFWINGIQGSILDTAQNDVVQLVGTLSGYHINFHRESAKSGLFVIELDNEEEIMITTWNKFVRIEIHGASYENFKGSVGLMGSFPDGKLLARDNKTIADDINVFGQEWQVLASEPMLFHDIYGPQAPQQRCDIPSANEMRRRLAQSEIAIEDANKACSHADDEDYDVCVFDVMATNNVEVALAY